VVRGSSFLHKGLRFALEFPAGWTIENGTTQVAAKEPGGRAVMVLQPVQRPQERTIEGTTTTVNGLPAYLGTYFGASQSLGRVQLRVLHVRHDRDVYIVAGISPIDEFARMDATFSKSVQSFRGLSPADAENVRPNRVGLYTARSGDTWQSVSERQSKGLVKATTLAIMNGHPVNDQPPPGERLKIVVGD